MKINIVGLGVGNIDYMTYLGIKTIKSSEVVIGGERQIKDITPILTNQTRYIIKNFSDMILFIEENREKNISVIVSGDTGFYSLLNYMKRYFKNEDLNIVPGISSFQYLFSKIGESWESYGLYSAHGRELDIIEVLKNSIAGIVLLTDNKNSPYYIGRILMKNKISGIKMIVGENLSYENEKISEFYLEDLEKYNRDFDMNVLIIKKEK